jgi:hypothetical protein
MDPLTVGTRGAILFLLYSLLSGTLAAQSEGLTELEIKAGFLYNFTKFVEWPEGAFVEARSPMILGILGENPVGTLLTQIAARQPVNGRPILVKQFKAGEDPRKCQILFAALKDQKRLAEVLGELKGAPVLTVGEGSGFTQAGGMIAFVVEGNKVRLRIDLEAASEAHLKISSKLIAVAKRVARETRGKN